MNAKRLICALAVVNIAIFSCIICNVYCETAESHFKKGVGFHKNGDYGQAIYEYNAAIAVDHNHDATYYNRGIAYAMKGDLDQAIRDYGKAIEINPSYSEAYVNRGTAYFHQNNIEQSISDFNKALEINPGNPKAYNYRGNVLAIEGTTNQAISDFTEAIKINPNYSDAYIARALAYFSKKEYTKSWEDVHKAESLGSKVKLDFLEMLKKVSGREQ